MYLFARFTCFLLLIAAGMSLPVACAFAQGGERNDSVTARETLPDAPESQAAVPPGQLSHPPQANPPAGTDEQNQKQDQTAQDPPPHRGDATISGTVTDTNGDVVPGASIVLEGPHPEDRRTATAGEMGAFQLEGLQAGVPYHISIEAHDLDSWKSDVLTLQPGQYFYMNDIKMKVPDLVTSVTVYASQEQIATQQVEVETKQRVLGIIPNFYVTYDDHPVPLSTRLKFKLALKSDTDVMTFVGVAFMAGIYQAGDTPDYGQGAAGFAKRVGAGYGDTTTDVFFTGAIYPWLFRHDPRYFYKGTGTVKSRVLHALASPYVCKGDNGKLQPNYSSMGGDLTSGAISNLYYPDSNRGFGLLFQGFAITTGVRTMTAVMQEFELRRFTPSSRAKY